MIAKCVRKYLEKPVCVRHGYVMWVGDNLLLGSENAAFTTYSKEPSEEELEEEEKVKAEKGEVEEVKGKDKKKDKKGKSSPMEEEVVEVVVELPLVSTKLPTHVICVPASDSYLLSKMNEVAVEGEDGKMGEIDEAAAAVYKATLEEYRSVVKKFGMRPKAVVGEGEEKGEEEEEEEKSEGKGGTSILQWLEEKAGGVSCGIKITQIPVDAIAAAALSVAFLEQESDRANYVDEFVFEGEVPGIYFMNGGGGEGGIESVVVKATIEETAVEEKKVNLPHEAMFESVSGEEVSEIQKFVDEYEGYAANTIMKEVTLGMMKVMKEGPVDPVDFLADYLIAKGKQAAIDGEEAARVNFDELLNHCEEMSSRMFKDNEDSTFVSRGMSFASSTR